MPKPNEVVARYPTLPPRERGEDWGEYLGRLEVRLKELEAAWGDWLRLPPRPGAYLHDPYLCWAWPRVQGEATILREAIRDLRRALRRYT